MKQMKFEEVLCELEGRNCFQRQSFTKCFRQTLVYMLNSALRESFSFCFSGEFYQCWQNFHFGRGTGRGVIIL